MGRHGAVTFKGNPLTLVGDEVKVGAAAPDFTLTGDAMQDIRKADLLGKPTIISVVPSLDTPVCHAETKRFNDEAKKLPNAEVLVVSMDLPFGAKRWCGAEGVETAKTLSAHRCTEFGYDYGVLIAGGPLDRCFSRAIFVVNAAGKLTYVEYVKEIADHPNYEAALVSAKG